MNISEEKIARIRLALTPSIGPITFKHLIAKFTNAVNAIKELPNFANKAGRIKTLKIPDKESILKYIDKCKNKNIEIITNNEQDYPKQLKIHNDSPIILHCLGKKELLNLTCVAIVGSRNASLQGRSFASKLARELTQNKINGEKIVVVSGLARGIDAASHSECTDSTIAVLANGVDIIYPQENKELYEKIAKNGLIISEEIIEKEPRPEAFTYRNRIISGLSQCVVIIEAAQKSGSLITAEYAAQQGIDVFAVPGHPYDYRAKGTNHLIKNGAFLLEKTEDILEHLHGIMNKQTNINLFDGKNHFLREDSFDNEDVKQYLSNNIGYAPITINEIMKISSFSITQIQGALAELEISEEISIEGNIVKKKNKNCTF